MISIDVKALSKTFKIYRSPIDRLKEILLSRVYHGKFHALSNVSFSVLQGESFGIIGENGAGKSTLLKILAKTLRQTSGTVNTLGRVTALLELGTGFNPELTGEENIYLNAYLVGLTKKEIDECKQDIISFSELGEFINRPVKTYSSGMVVRLAFSIATTVNPDILIIDEALSVGDDYFQKKCIDRMKQFRKVGKTILFCSHDLFRIQGICNRTIWLHQGEIKSIGTSDNVVMEYKNHERKKLANPPQAHFGQGNTLSESDEKPIKIIDHSIMNHESEEVLEFNFRDTLLLSITTKCGSEAINGHLGFLINRNDEIWIFGSMTQYSGLQPIHFEGVQNFKLKIRNLPILSGKYEILIGVVDDSGVHVYDTLKSKSITIKGNNNKEHGIVFIEHEWMI